MNKKINIENIYSDYDDRLLAKKIADISEKSARGFQCCSSNFLDPAQQEIAFKVINGLSGAYHKWNGGFEEAERRTLVIAPEEWLLDEYNEVEILKFAWNSKYSKSISHRDVLGSLMGLGIEREIIGDIKVLNDTAYIAVINGMADFITMNLEKIGNANVKVEICNEVEAVSDRYKEVIGSIASCRLDALVAEAFNLSRNEAQELVRSGKVRLNYKMIESISAEVQEKDLISVKGFGRARLWTLKGKTKKERESVLIRKYI